LFDSWIGLFAATLFAGSDFFEFEVEIEHSSYFETGQLFISSSWRMKEASNAPKECFIWIPYAKVTKFQRFIARCYKIASSTIRPH